jgi:hypothetical protein
MENAHFRFSYNPTRHSPITRTTGVRDAGLPNGMERSMQAEAVKIGMKEGELRAALGAPYRVQLAGASMVYRWQDAAGEEAGEWLRVRLRRVSGQGLSNAIVDQVEGRCGGVAIAMP